MAWKSSTLEKFKGKIEIVRTIMSCLKSAVVSWKMATVHNFFNSQCCNEQTTQVIHEVQPLQQMHKDESRQLTEGWTRRMREIRLDDGVAAADVTALPCKSNRRFCAIAAFCCFRSSSIRLADSLAAKPTGVGVAGVAASCWVLSDTFSCAAAATFCFSTLTQRQTKLCVCDCVWHIGCWNNSHINNKLQIFRNRLRCHDMSCILQQPWFLLLCRIHFPWLIPDFPGQNESFSLTNLFMWNTIVNFQSLVITLETRAVEQI